MNNTLACSETEISISRDGEVSGDLRFVSSHSELRTCVRVFGNEFFPQKFTTGVRKRFCTGDRNRKAGKSEWCDRMFGEEYLLAYLM